MVNYETQECVIRAPNSLHTSIARVNPSADTAFTVEVLLKGLPDSTCAVSQSGLAPIRVTTVAARPWPELKVLRA